MKKNILLLFIFLTSLSFFSCSNDDSTLIVDYDFELSLKADDKLELGEAYAINLFIENFDKKNDNDIELKLNNANRLNITTRGAEVQEDVPIVIPNKDLPNVTYSIISNEAKDDSLCFVVSNGVITRSITHQIRRTDYIGTFQVITTAGGKVENVKNKYNIEEEVNITAVPDEGYLFEGFYDLDGEILSSSTDFSFIYNGEQKIYCRFAPKEFNIQLSVSTGGQVTGSGVYKYGTTATLIATPEKNYTFNAWMEADTIVASSPTYSFTVTRELSIEAKFKGVDLAVVGNSSAGGKVTGSGSYEYGSTATLVATPDGNYTFDGWYNGSTKVSSSVEYSFTVTQSCNFEARFKGDPFKVTVNTLGDGGTVSGSGTYDYNSTVTVVATTKNNYTFEGWYEGSTKVSTSASYSFTLTSARNLEAKFKGVDVSIVANAGAGGTVSGTKVYEYGSTATLVATPNKNYTFSGWYNGSTKVSSSTSYSFTATTTLNLEAQFKGDPFKVTVNTLSDGGTVSGSGTYDYNSTITVVATTKNNYTFEGWYEGATKVSSSASYSFTLTSARNLEAKFKGVDVSIVANAAANGSTTGTATYEYGTTATVVATPNAKYIFDGWYNGSTKVSSSTSYTFTVTTALNLEAKFKGEPLQVTVNAQNSNGTVSGSGTYDYNSTVTVTASAKTNYTFTGWYEDGTRVSTSASYTFTIASARALEARFKGVDVSIVANAAANGSTTGTATYEYGTTATVVATPNVNYTFAGWYNNSTKVSSSASYTFTVTTTLNLEARFTVNSYAITTTTETGGTVSGAGTFDHGTSVTVVATVSTGYSFDGWYEGATRVSTNTSYTFTATAARTLTAKYTVNKYNVTVSAGTGGSASGAGTFNHGTSVTVTGAADTGYSFAGWYEGATKVSSSASYTFTITAGRSLEARYTINQYTLTVASNNTSYGTVSGGGSYNYNTSVTIAATPKAASGNISYSFVKWNDNNTNASRQVTVTGATTYTATFQKEEWVYTVTANTDYLSFVSAGGSKSCTITAQRRKYIDGSATSTIETVAWTHSLSGSGFSVANGGGTCTVTASENSATTMRTATLTISAGGQSVIIDLEQERKYSVETGIE